MRWTAVQLCESGVATSTKDHHYSDVNISQSSRLVASFHRTSRVPHLARGEGEGEGGSHTLVIYKYALIFDFSSFYSFSVLFSKCFRCAMQCSHSDVISALFGAYSLLGIQLQKLR
ncbi:hypothetical protein E2C01_064835 [Portunus trituberculatus]|uniref:Uncharacterized protein n=1 Tax=Portunus trituberculatus TaxID=210409 RepID=A0A5B7HK85_PORTR|nr:hypothetical protein [Portunus trituberculatus]